MEYLIGGVVIGSVFTVVALGGMVLSYRIAFKQMEMYARYWKGKYQLLSFAHVEFDDEDGN